MVNGNTSPDVFVPLDLTADQLPAESVDVMSQQTSGTLQPQVTPIDVLDTLSSISSLVNIAGTIAEDVAAAVKGVDFTQLGKLFSSIGGFASDALKVFDKDQILVMDNWSQYLPTSGVVHELLAAGLGINPDKLDDDGVKALRVLDNTGAFVIALLFISASVDLLGKIPLASRFPEGITEAIKKLPEELGIGWFIGNSLEVFFEAAIGNALQRNIKRQMMLDEPEWPVIRMMIRQHIDPPYGLRAALQNAGFNKDWQDAIMQLESAPLPIGDIQALYQNEIIGDTDIDPLLHKLGFADDVTKWLKQLYITKAETSAGAEIRSVFRSLYRESLVSKTDYVDALTRANYPKRMIDDDLYAIDTEKNTGWRAQSVSVIKSDYLHHPGTQQIAINKLVVLGYPQAEAADMVASWTAPPIRREHGLTESQILKYMIAGLISPTDARPKLQALGLDSDTVSFLLSHPTMPANARPAKLTPALATQAFVLGAITQDQYYAALQQIGLTGDVLDYTYRAGIYKYSHHHNPGSGTTALDKGEVREAFKLGLMDEQTAMGLLEGMGYSADNALLLLEITNKGEITPAPAPVFPNVQAAFDYLTSLGFTFTLPISSTYEAALQMVEQAGYSPVPPANFTPPTTNPQNLITGGQISAGLPLLGGGTVP